MRTILVEGELNQEDEVVNSVIREIENHFLEAEQPEINIYIESNGGGMDEAIKLAHFINTVEEKELAKINLIANFRIRSAGLLVFLIAKCNSKEVLPYTCGTVHLGDRLVKGRESRKEGTQANFDKKDLDFINDRLTKLMRKCGLSEEKMKEFEKGDDVHLNTEELTDLIEMSDMLKSPFDMLY